MKKSIIYILLGFIILNIVIGGSSNMVFAKEEGSAIPTGSKVLVNNKDISFDAYLIEDNNYFKLRDLASIVNKTEKQFEVKWDEKKRAINLISKKSYTKVGGEMARGDGKKQIAILNNDSIYKDGVQVKLKAYNIKGNNYFKLRDIAKTFDIGITYDDVTKTIGIDTSLSYIEPENNKSIGKIDLTTEKAIRDYLEGEWIYDYYYRGDIICKMKIDKDLNLTLSFKNSISDQPEGTYSGKIKLDRLYANSKQGPDLISIELKDKNKPGGDFFFSHRTIYDKKQVMSWFFAGNGNTIFDVEDSIDGFTTTPEEIIFEKTNGEISKQLPRKNDSFYAVYWGKGKDGKSMWLDDVELTAEGEDKYGGDYPYLMTNYNNTIKESVLYSLVPEEVNEVFGDDLSEAGLYYVETDSKARVKYFIGADRKEWIENNYITPEIRERVYDTIKTLDQAREYLRLGMTIEFEGNTIMIDGDEYYEVVLGTQHGGDHFVREIFYAVDTFSKKIYEYDILNDAYELVSGK